MSADSGGDGLNSYHSWLFLIICVFSQAIYRQCFIRLTFSFRDMYRMEGPM